MNYNKHLCMNKLSWHAHGYKADLFIFKAQAKKLAFIA